MLEELKQEVDGFAKDVSPLLQGIVSDFQTLFRQEVALAKAELEQELAVAQMAGIGFGLSAALGSLASLLLSVTVALLLSWTFPRMPLWGSFALLTVLLGTAAAVALHLTRGRLDSARLIPKHTLETLKENARWIKSRI